MARKAQKQWLDPSLRYLGGTRGTRQDGGLAGVRAGVRAGARAGQRLDWCNKLVPGWSKAGPPAPKSSALARLEDAPRKLGQGATYRLRFPSVWLAPATLNTEEACKPGKLYSHTLPPPLHRTASCAL